jgi:tRNA(Arg) A34 adenosine deaminase TadA
VRGGSVVSVGFNSITKNSFVDHLAESCEGYIKPFVNQHAEVNSILKVRNKIDLTGCKAYVVRQRPSGGMGMSRPCNLCQNALYRYGIKRAIYSISSHEHGVLNLADDSDVIHSMTHV